jgi:hypothetical protein
LIVGSYIEGRDICKQDDLSAVAIVAFFSLLFFLSLSCYLIGTDDDRLHRSSLSLSSPEGDFMLD